MSTPADAAAAALADAIGLRRDRAMERRLARAIADAAGAAGRPPGDHARVLRDDPAALQDLIDRVTVQESAFFRHPEQFEVLARYLTSPEAAAVPPRQRLIWSAGCADGEEPWSLAMLLAELDLPDWRILATDVSRRALARAEAGVFSQRRLRGLSAARVKRFVRVNGSSARIAPALGERVRFAHHSLTADPVPHDVARCPVVLCRNVLIYLRTEDARRLLDAIAERLRPDGLLLIGAGEALPPDDPAFEPERRGEAFVYRPRRTAAPRRPAGTEGSGTRSGVPNARRRPAPAPARVAMASASEHADTGERLAAAGAHAAAADAFRRAAYLEPSNPLHHLRRALALEAAGGSGSDRAFAAAQHALREGGRPDPAALEGWTLEDLEQLLAAKLGTRR